MALYLLFVIMCSDW